MLRKYTFLSILLVAVGQFSCSGDDYFPPPEAVGGWRKNTAPAFIRALHLDPDEVAALGKYGISVRSHEISSVLIIKDGWIVGEWYSAPEGKTTPIYIASVGKSFATICFGIAVKDSREGRLPHKLDKNAKVYDPRWLSVGFPLSDQRKKYITFDQIFQHTSGLTPQASTAEQTIVVEQGRNQWDNYLDWVVGHDPAWPQTGGLYFTPGEPEEYPGHAHWGTHRGAYSSVGYAHIGLVLAELYQMPAHQFLQSRLLDPLGFSAIDYEAPPAPPEIKWFSAGGLKITPRDFARFAYFLLHKGRWQDQWLVPKDWIDSFVSTPHYDNLRSNSDGYFGEHYPKDLFRVYGSGGNFAFIIPSQGLIVLKTGRIDNFLLERHMHDFLRRTFMMIPGFPVQ